MVSEALAWALYRDILEKDPRSQLAQLPEDYFFPDGKPSSQMPEAYDTYRQIQRYHQLWWMGGLADQPHLLMKEIDACADGVSRYENVLMPWIMETAHPKKESL